MDQTAPQQNPTAYTSPGSSGTFKTIIIFLLALIVGLAIGFIIRPLITPLTPQKATNLPTNQPSKSPQPSQKPTIDESKLPISLALLTNPIVYEWRGSVKGKLTKKDEHTLTLVDDQGNSITITDIMPSGDKFNTTFFEPGGKKQVSLKDIPLGSILIGDFFIFPKGSDIPVGGLFTKQK